MKITASKLRQIIREETQRLAEVDSLKPGDYALGAYFSVEKMGRFEKAMLDLFNDALRSASNDLGDPEDAYDAVMAGFEMLIERVQSDMRPLEIIDKALHKDNDMDTDNDGKISADELRDEIEDIRDDL